jgi:hypothetical protein
MTQSAPTSYSPGRVRLHWRPCLLSWPAISYLQFARGGWLGSAFRLPVDVALDTWIVFRALAQTPIQRQGRIARLAKCRLPSGRRRHRGECATLC